MDPERAALQEAAEALCRVFLGWRLREDEDALLALGEGELAIDLLSGESWCDGEPLPTLFIAEELRRELARELERAGLGADALREARLEALFSRRRRRALDAGGGPPLALACRSRLVTAAGEWSAEAHNG